jgi:hypothetical protein
MSLDMTCEVVELAPRACHECQCYGTDKLLLLPKYVVHTLLLAKVVST